MTIKKKTTKTAETTAAPVRAKKAPAEIKHPISQFTTAAFYNKLIDNVSLSVLDKLVEYINAYSNGKRPKANSISSLLDLFTWRETPEGKMYWLRFDMEYKSEHLSALNNIQFARSKIEPKKDVFKVSNSEMNSIEISVPGYVLDTENSTPGRIVLKAVTTAVEEPKKPVLPKTWEELKQVKGYYVNVSSEIIGLCTITETRSSNKNMFVTKEQAEAAIALAQLSQLREVYRQGWVPNWKDDKNQKFAISYVDMKTTIDSWRTTREYFLSFQSKEIAEQFLENFRDLIEQSRPLMS